MVFTIIIFTIIWMIIDVTNTSNVIREFYKNNAIVLLLLICLTIIVCIEIVYSKNFLDSFLPNILSTLIGVIVGLPTALYANRKLNAFSNRSKKLEQLNRLSKSIEITNNSIINNKTALITMLANVNEKTSVLTTNLDITSWDIVKNELINNQINPIITNKLAYYFNQITNIEILCRKHLDYTIGVNAALGFGAEDTKKTITLHIRKSVPNLILYGDTLLKEIKEDLEKYNIAFNYANE